MKVIMFRGTSKTGKTTTAEAVIKELRKRGFTVGSVKNIHFEDFAIDTEGTNTDRHRKAGASTVTARGFHETDIMYDRQLDIEDILDQYSEDYVVLEGDPGANCPIVVTGRTKEDVDEQIDPFTIAISGVVADSLISESENGKYRGLPVINALSDVERLTDLIEAKTPDRLPNYSKDCCIHCDEDGCRGLAAEIIAGKRDISECILRSENVSLAIDGEELPMVPFVKDIVKGSLVGIVRELRGYKEGSEIVIKIKGD